MVSSSSCFLHYSPLFSYSSQCPSQPPFLFPFPKHYSLTKKRKNGVIMSSLNQENPKDNNFGKRKAILFMGFASFMPLVNMRAEAFESESAELKPEDLEPKPKQTGGNPLVSLLNALGFLGSGVLAALYALTVKEKDSSDAAIESMNIKLKEKDGTIKSLVRSFEKDLSKEREARDKALAKANEEQQTLINKLNLANSTIKNLGQELQNEKILVEELKAQAEHLEASLIKVKGEKTEQQEQLKEKMSSIQVLEERISLLSLEIKGKEGNLQELNSKLAEKEDEYNELSLAYKQSQEQIIVLNLEIEKLKDIIGKNEVELDLKNEKVTNLSSELASTISERDEISKNLNSVQKEYHHFKSSSEEKEASNAKLLEERNDLIRLLEEQLKVALVEANRNESSIADLTKEKDGIREFLNIELKNVKNLEHELQITHKTLENAKEEASDLGKQLENSRHLCSELESEIIKVRDEFSETKQSLQKKIDEAKEGSRVLAAELESANELLTKSNQELLTMSEELASAVQKSESLEKELVQAQEKFEIATHELKEEKKAVSSMSKELEALESQISKEKGARKIVESDLDEATKSLDEMNRNALMISKDLVIANSRISSLEVEKDALYKSLDEQKQVSQEYRENLEDAHNLVMRLGKEREILESRGKKLEEELGSAKGEILRLRSEKNSASTKINDKQHVTVDVGETAAVPVKKVTRRRKVTPKKEDS